MAQIKFLVDADLGQNAIVNVALQSLATAPHAASEVLGELYWDTVLDKLRIWDGAAWVNLNVDTDTLGPDGDKGDITVGGTGTTLTIDASAVTYAKIQKVAANNVFLGNDNGATQDVQEITKAEALIILNVADGADVTDSTSVNAAGAVMESDISATPSGRIIDDDTFATASNTTLATSESIKAYVDGAVTSGMTFKGAYNASTNSPALDTGSPVLEIGDTYTVTVAGTFFSEPLEIGDVIMAEVDSVDAAAFADWTIVQTNLDAATETTPGFIELATQTEVNTGTDVDRAVTPDKLEDKTMGTYTGTTITDNVVLKVALQELETAVEAGGGSPILEVTADTAAALTTTVTHNFNTRKVQVDIHRKTTPWDKVIAQIDAFTLQTVIVRFNTATTAGEYEITVRAIDLT